jgi:hypothetical protein
MRMRCTLPSQGDVFRSVSCQFRLSRTRNCPAAVPRADPATGISPRPEQLGEVVEPLSDPPGDVAAVFTLETRFLTRRVDKAVSR